jgi:hypothetical protein
MTHSEARRVIFRNGADSLRFYAGVIYDADGILLSKRFGLEELYERFQSQPHVLEMEESWRAACALAYFGLPLSKRETTLGEEFFYQLGAGNPVLSKYSALIADHANRNDLEFFKQIANARKRPRGRPKAKEPLYPLLLQGWRHLGFWLMTNTDRVKVIQDLLGYRIVNASGLPDERITKAAQRLELLSWSDFPDTYQEPPLKITTYQSGRVDFLFTDRWERTEIA